jgi:DNA anti-recombination protein RmuC
MIHKTRSIIFGVCSLFLIAQATEKQDEFVFAKPGHQKKLSQSVLKEKIGTTTQELFDGTTLFGQTIGDVEIALSHAQCQCVTCKAHAHEALKKIMESCAACNRACGELHKKLAVMQRKCSAIGEKLIDNEKPFKHASKAMLESTLSVLSTTHQKLQQGVDKLHTMLPAFATAASERVHESIQRVAQELQSLDHMMGGASSAFTTDECLKNT